MPRTDAPIHAFWGSGELTPLAHACVASFVAHGHNVHVHAYARVRLPAGTRLEDAREIIATDDPAYRHLTVDPAGAFAQVFAYEGLRRLGGWWVAPDVYCLSDSLPGSPCAWAEQETGLVGSAVLKFPAGDPRCARLAALARERIEAHARWGALGPDLATEVLDTREITDRAGSRRAYFPLHPLEAHDLWLPEFRDEVERRTANAHFLPCWVADLEAMGIDAARIPPGGSFLARILAGAPGLAPSTPRIRSATRRSLREYQRQRWVKEYWLSREGQDWNVRARAADAGTSRGVLAFARTRWRKRLRDSVLLPLRARRMGVRLPPGSLAPCQDALDTDQRFFLDRARTLGPVFKVESNGGYTTCVVGHERGSRLVSEHNDRLPGHTIDLKPLFPIGAMREMSGDTHRHYRRLFLHAIQSTPVSAHAEAVTEDIRRTLRTLAATAVPQAGDELRDTLRRLTSAIMLRFLFGLDPASARYRELEVLYRRFGPHAPVHQIRDEHADRFARITALVHLLARDIAAGTPGPPSFLRQMVGSGALDETAMGNLAYMFEPSHFDMYSLWHWMLRFLGNDPAVAAAYRGRVDPASRRAYVEAIVQESLRMEQSELLYRRVTEDIAFEGFLLPRNTTLRVCLWEGHKDPEAFPDPFAFRPERFLGRSHGLDTYAPFGLGPRHCLGAQLVTGLCSIFVKTLLDDYDVQVSSDGPARHGSYHWQPNQAMAIRLVPLTRATA